MARAITYFPPVFCYGQVALAWVAGAGLVSDRVFVLDEAVESYAEGDCVFATDADGGALQYIGRVAAVDYAARTIEVTLGLAAEMAAPWRVWQPARSCALDRGSGYGVEQTVYPGVRSRSTRGGLVFSTQVADRIDLLSFVWEKGRGILEDFAAVRDYFLEQRQAGTLSSALAWWDHVGLCRRVSQVRMRFVDSERDLMGTGHLLADVAARNRGDFALTFYLERVSGYVMR